MSRRDSARKSSQASKKHRATAKDSESDAKSESLLIGRRPLPSDLERLCFSFLDIADIANGLFFASRGLSKTIVRFLAELRTLHGTISVRKEDKSAAPALVLKHCKALTHAVVSFRKTSKTWSESPWLVRLVNNNKASLRALRCDRFPPSVLDALVECPNLEQLNSGGLPLSQLALSRLSAAHLPRLREIAIEDRFQGCAQRLSTQDVLKVVESGFPLTSLSIAVDLSADVSWVLLLPRFRQLQRLRLVLAFRHELVRKGSLEVATALLRGLNDALNTMPTLESLDLDIRSGETCSDADREKLSAISWTFLNLQKLSLTSTFLIGSWPTIKAPKLEQFECSLLDTLVPTLRTFLGCPSLQKIDLHLRPVNAQVDPSMQRFLNALRENGWPQLKTLQIHDEDDYRLPLVPHESRAQYNVVAALCARSPGLRHIDIRTGVLSHALIRKLLAAHPQAKRVRVKGTELDEEDTAEEPASPLTMRHLRSLHLNAADDALFQRLSLPSLVSLTLYSSSVVLSSLRLLVDACPSMRRLDLQHIELDDWSLPACKLKLQHLTFQPDCEASKVDEAAAAESVARLLHCCPALEILKKPYRWSGLADDTTFLAAFAESLAKHSIRLPYLRSLGWLWQSTSVHGKLELKRLRSTLITAFPAFQKELDEAIAVPLRPETARKSVRRPDGEHTMRRLNDDDEQSDFDPD